MRWEIVQNKNLFFGPGSLEKLKDVLTCDRPSGVLLMTYSRNAAGVSTITRILDEEKIPYLMDAQVVSEPDVDMVDRIASRAAGCDHVLALGGGSVLDAAKAVSMLLTNGGSAEEYQMDARPVLKRPMPLTAVPTTAGTGSEATKVSVVYNPRNRLKKSFYSPYMIAGTVILDPEVTLGLPRAVTAATGVDALSHAIESYVSLNATPYTEMLSLKAMGLVRENLPLCLEDGKNMEARGNMLLASYLAGCALNAGIGLAHMIAQPVGGLFHIPHGDACSVFLPYAMEYNVECCVKKYSDVARCFGDGGREDTLETARRGIALVKEFLHKAGTPRSICGYIRGPFDLEETVRIVEGATSHITCNPRKVDKAAVREVLQKTAV